MQTVLVSSLLPYSRGFFSCVLLLREVFQGNYSSCVSLKKSFSFTRYVVRNEMWLFNHDENKAMCNCLLLKYLMKCHIKCTYVSWNLYLGRLGFMQNPRTFHTKLASGISFWNKAGSIFCLKYVCIWPRDDWNWKILCNNGVQNIRLVGPNSFWCCRRFCFSETCVLHTSQKPVELFIFVLSRPSFCAHSIACLLLVIYIFLFHQNTASWSH